MKTIIIWDDCQANIKFFIVPRDVSHLNHKYLNSVDVSDDEANEISSLVYENHGNVKVELLSEFPSIEMTQDTKIITCGFLP